MENKLIEKLKVMPKVELHMHLDGSIPISYVIKKYNITKEEIKSKMIADEKCKNLNDYLTKFDYPISIMQTKEELQDITIQLLNELKEQNVGYVEIRFAPQFHTNKGLSQEEVIKTVIDAKNMVDIKSNSSHPLEKLYKYGILTTINTDNMTVLNTDLLNEYINIIDNTSLTYADIEKMNKNSIKAAFLSIDEKNKLLNKYWEE